MKTRKESLKTKSTTKHPVRRRGPSRGHQQGEAKEGWRCGQREDEGNPERRATKSGRASSSIQSERTRAAAQNVETAATTRKSKGQLEGSDAEDDKWACNGNEKSEQRRDANARATQSADENRVVSHQSVQVPVRERGARSGSPARTKNTPRTTSKQRVHITPQQREVGRGVRRNRRRKRSVREVEPCVRGRRPWRAA